MGMVIQRVTLITTAIKSTLEPLIVQYGLMGAVEYLWAPGIYTI
jgi:hypothetical protein